jgi:hypothetical protein
MRAIKKNSGPTTPTDPPNKGKTRVMGLTRKYYDDPVTVHTPRTQNQRGPYASEKIKSGDVVGPGQYRHRRGGVGVSRAVDPTKKGSKDKRGSRDSVKDKPIKKYDEGGRLERQLKRKKRKLDKISPQEGSGPANKGMMTFDMSDSGGCPPGQKRGLKGSCEKGNLRAEKSVAAKGLKKEKTKANLAGKGLPQKRKKLTAEITDLEKRLKAMKKPGKFTNPRFL